MLGSAVGGIGHFWTWQNNASNCGQKRCQCRSGWCLPFLSPGQRPGGPGLPAVAPHSALLLVRRVLQQLAHLDSAGSRGAALVLVGEEKASLELFHSSSRELRIPVPTFSVVHFRRKPSPKKETVKGHLAGGPSVGLVG